MKVLLLLLLAAAPLTAHPAPVREAFPDDYVTSPCAPTAEQMCGGVKKVDLANLAFRFRGVTLDHAWVDAHWDEMKNDALGPLCTKMANCYTIRGNTTVWCQDILRQDFLSACDRFPEGSRDREQCGIFATTYFITLGVRTQLLLDAQKCMGESGAAARTLQAWIAPDPVTLDGAEPLTLHALDSERRIPVMAMITTDGGGKLKAVDGPRPTASIPFTWQRKLKRVAREDGHSDLVAPTLTVTAEGYEPLTIEIPVTVPQLVVNMSPAGEALQKGSQQVTINAHDAATGAPVEMRVLGDGAVLGTTNVPFTLTIGQKRPEIWLTSLFDHYSDVVVVPRTH